MNYFEVVEGNLQRTEEGKQALREELQQLCDRMPPEAPTEAADAFNSDGVSPYSGEEVKLTSDSLIEDMNNRYEAAKKRSWDEFWDRHFPNARSLSGEERIDVSNVEGKGQ